MQEKKHKIIFFGTPEFAASILEKIAKTKYCPILVLTAQDKPTGRKQILTPSPVKNICKKYNLPILQIKNFREQKTREHLIALKPDLFIVAAYGLIFPKDILQIPKYGCLNVHPSLLPKYRGSSPIQACILNGDKKTGVSLILMDEQIDHGPILAKKKIKIEKETTPDLNNKLSNLGAEILIETLPNLFKNKIKPKKQKNWRASFTRQIKKIHGKINWQKKAKEIEQMWRAYQPWPGIYTFLNNKVLKIIKLEILKTNSKIKPGQVFLTKNKELAVGCQKNALILKKIQLEGKKIVSGKDFINGHQNIINKTL